MVLDLRQLCRSMQLNSHRFPFNAYTNFHIYKYIEEEKRDEKKGRKKVRKSPQ